MNALILIIALTIGNLIGCYLWDISLITAFERSYFQAVAIFVYAWIIKEGKQHE